MKKLLRSSALLCLFPISSVMLGSTGPEVVRHVSDTGYFLFDKAWRFHTGDDMKWADPGFSDEGWDTASTSLLYREFDGIGWFRIRLRLDSALNSIPLAFFIEQTGASEIYFNGQLAKAYGVVSSKAEEEERHNPQGNPVFLNYSPGQQLLIAVRYSNHSSSSSYTDGGKRLPGFLSLLIPSRKHIDTLLQTTNLIAVGSNFLFGFFFALGLAHLFIYLFYRKYRANIYYFIFVLLLSHYILFLHFTINVNNNNLAGAYFTASSVLFPHFFVSLLALVYSFFRDRFPLFLKLMALAALADSALLLWGLRAGAYLLFVIATACSIEALRFIIAAIMGKKKGARIVGTGVLIFGLFILLVAVISAFTGGFVITNGGIVGFLLLVLCLLCVMSIPIFMSVYLAWDFAQTSKNLSLKLTEVEELSAKTLEQEKEKQKILETQKEMLEQQVQERTQEVVLQKLIIEEKNKDITDSINYAKRIQDAFLPAREIKYRLFPEAFVLFQPRDIVSGDFYWFTEKNGRKMIAAADCTGHGVPGAFMSMIGNAFLNEVVNERGITRPGEVLGELRHRIIQSLKQTGSEIQSKDGMDIALLSFDNESSSVEYSGANNPLWLVRSREFAVGSGKTQSDRSEISYELQTPDYELIEFEPNKRPIGYYLGKDLPFSSHNIPIQKGDALYIFTDGFADQFGGPKGKKFKYRPLQELLMSIQHQPMAEQERILLETFNAWKGDLAQVDDVLVIGIRI